MPDRVPRPVGNLPAELTRFVGRGREVTDVRTLLTASRLLTLTGPGGVGKTRLALRVADQARRAFPDGVWLVALDQLREDALIVQTVARSLGLVQHFGGSPLEALVEYLAGRQLLLVLDNCEHLVAAAAKLADHLLRAAPEVRILATSREPLGVGGETTWLVPPLPTPDPLRLLSLSEMARYDAVSLFTERAALVKPDFQLTEANKQALAEVCHLLEGLPLAIELAAARVRVLSAEQIRARLSDRFAMLTRGSRAAPDRQQTLRGCVEWSYELCTHAERRLWARLSVFASGFDLDAAEHVCTGGELAADDMLELIASLIDKSILARDDDGTAARYHMLEALRDFGTERLIELGGDRETRRRHRDYYATLARRAEAAWTGPDQLAWAQTLRREHANIQAALTDCLRDPSEVDAAQEFAGHLWFFWIACGFLREGRYYLDRAVALGGQGPSRRWALWACAFAAGSQGDMDVAQALAEQCRQDAIANHDLQLATYALETQSMILALRGEIDPAVERMRQCLTYYRGLEDLDVGLLRTLPMLGTTLVMRGDADAALELAPECQQLCERLGERWQRSYVDHFIGLALQAKGDPAGAAHHLVAAIETKHQFHDIVGLVLCIEPLACAVAELGDGVRAARLLGAAQHLWQTFGLPAFWSPFHSSQHEQTEQRARHLLDPAAYERAFTEGLAMDLDETTAYILNADAARSETFSPGTPARPANPLTPRETQVAELVGQGLTNRQIAARLVISTRTAESHVEHILAKLGFTKRTQLAAWMADQHPQ